jgi:hypothetical protein
LLAQAGQLDGVGAGTPAGVVRHERHPPWRTGSASGDVSGARGQAHPGGHALIWWSRRSLRSCVRATLGSRRQCGATTWNGSAKLGKYFGLDLQVFRLRRADFDPPHCRVIDPIRRSPPTVAGSGGRQVRRPRQDLPPDPSAPRCIPVRNGAGKEQADAAPRCLGRRPDRTSDRVTRRAECAMLLGLGVSTRRSCPDANPWR